MKRFTHLGRPIDLTYPTNRWIAIITTSTIIIVAEWGLLTQILSVSQALLQGIKLAGAVFLAWALARETDPDAQILAFFVIPPTILLVYWLGTPAFDLLFLMLLLMRIVNRTTGLAATLIDVLLVLALTAWVARDGAWYIVLCTAIAFALDSFMVQPSRHWWVAMLSLIATIGLYLTKGGVIYTSTLPAALIGLVFAGVLGTTAMLLFTPKVGSKSDQGGLIHLPRLRASWLLALLLALLTICFVSNGFALLSPFWSVIIIVGTYRLILWAINL